MSVLNKSIQNMNFVMNTSRIYDLIILDRCDLFWGMSAWTVFLNSAVFTSACSAKATYWALHARCQPEWRVSKPCFFHCSVPFCIFQSKIILFCSEATGITVCCVGDFIQQITTGSWIMERQMTCWAKVSFKHCWDVSLSQCYLLLMWR